MLAVSANKNSPRTFRFQIDLTHTALRGPLTFLVFSTTKAVHEFSKKKETPGIGIMKPSSRQLGVPRILS